MKSLWNKIKSKLESLFNGEQPASVSPVDEIKQYEKCWRTEEYTGPCTVKNEEGLVPPGINSRIKDTEADVSRARLETSKEKIIEQMSKTGDAEPIQVVSSWEATPIGEADDMIDAVDIIVEEAPAKVKRSKKKSSKKSQPKKSSKSTKSTKKKKN